MADAIVAIHLRSAAAQSGFAAAWALAALSRHTSCVTLTVVAAVLAPQLRIKRSRADGVLLEQPIAALAFSGVAVRTAPRKRVVQYYCAKHVSRDNCDAWWSNQAAIF